MTIATLLTLLDPLVLLLTILGGWLVLRSSIAHAEQDIQARVRQGLHDENELLHTRVERLEKENRRYNDLMRLVVMVLKKLRNIDLEIDGDMVTLRDPISGTHSASLQSPDIPTSP